MCMTIFLIRTFLIRQTSFLHILTGKSNMYINEVFPSLPSASFLRPIGLLHLLCTIILSLYVLSGPTYHTVSAHRSSRHK